MYKAEPLKSVFEWGSSKEHGPGNQFPQNDTIAAYFIVLLGGSDEKLYVRSIKCYMCKV